jgi:hypothetical protein
MSCAPARLIVSIAALLCFAVEGGVPIAANADPSPREVNITSDSAPGWIPSADLERQARKTAQDYLAARDSGRYADAYALLAEPQQRDEPLAGFTDRLRHFNAIAGSVQERRFLVLTWTKDPAHAPVPGVYVAIDLASRFAGIDRHCGYLVLYQAPPGGDFRVMREEESFLDNATAASSSKTEVEQAWARVSANCPNYRQASAPSAQDQPLPEANESTIGYPTVAAALAGLHARVGVVFSMKDGWTVANDEAAHAIWSFPPPGHPAYPAAVKRSVVEENGAVKLDLRVLCEASKAACDDLVREFQKLDAKLSSARE